MNKKNFHINKAREQLEKSDYDQHYIVGLGNLSVDTVVSLSVLGALKSINVLCEALEEMIEDKKITQELISNLSDPVYRETINRIPLDTKNLSLERIHLYAQHLLKEKEQNEEI